MTTATISTVLSTALHDFNGSMKFIRKRPWYVALVITQHARKTGLLLDPHNFLMAKCRQILGKGDAERSILSSSGRFPTKINALLGIDVGPSFSALLTPVRIDVEAALPPSGP